MGVWGASNFDDDKALDYLAADVVAPLVKKLKLVIDEPSLAEPDERSSAEIMVAVEVLSLLCENCNAVPPQAKLVKEAWEAYLRIWDGYIDQLLPKPDYKRERRRVIEASFSRLHQLAASWHEPSDR